MFAQYISKISKETSISNPDNSEDIDKYLQDLDNESILLGVCIN